MVVLLLAMGYIAAVSQAVPAEFCVVLRGPEGPAAQGRTNHDDPVGSVILPSQVR